MRGIVNTRRLIMQELGWEPEWEVNPKELKLIEKIGQWGCTTGSVQDIRNSWVHTWVLGAQGSRQLNVYCPIEMHKFGFIHMSFTHVVSIPATEDMKPLD